MTPEQAKAHREVIDAAKDFERASEYGRDARAAGAAYDAARERQREVTGGEGRG